MFDIYDFRRPIPKDELKKLGIPLPPEGRYMSRFQVVAFFYLKPILGILFCLFLFQVSIFFADDLQVLE
jgi:hypothetical protein